MSDPVTASLALGAGGLAMQGTGALASAFGNPGGPAQIDPAIQAELQARGIDINQFMAQNQAGQFNALTPFAQSLQQYGPEMQQALLNAYSQNYGGAEGGAAQLAQGILTGQQTGPYANMLSTLGQNVGMQRQQGTNAINQNLAQSGISADSPLAQHLLQNQNLSSQAQYTGGASQLQSALIPYALQILQEGQNSNRLAGTQNPAIPQTAQQQAQAAQQAASQGVASNLQSGLSGLGTHPGILGFANLFGNLIQPAQEAQTPGLLPNAVPSNYNRNVSNWWNTPESPQASAGGQGSWFQPTTTGPKPGTYTVINGKTIPLPGMQNG